MLYCFAIPGVAAKERHIPYVKDCLECYFHWGVDENHIKDKLRGNTTSITRVDGSVKNTLTVEDNPCHFIVMVERG